MVYQDAQTADQIPNRAYLILNVVLFSAKFFRTFFGCLMNGIGMAGLKSHRTHVNYGSFCDAGNSHSQAAADQ